MIKLEKCQTFISMVRDVLKSTLTSEIKRKSTDIVYLSETNTYSIQRISIKQSVVFIYVFVIVHSWSWNIGSNELSNGLEAIQIISKNVNWIDIGMCCKYQWVMKCSLLTTIASFHGWICCHTHICWLNLVFVRKKSVPFQMNKTTNGHLNLYNQMNMRC